VAKVSVADTCQSTATSAFAMPPCPSAFSGDGAGRVHRTTLSAAGSPEATPSLKGNGVAARAMPAGRATDPAAARPPRMNVRRCMVMAIT
jgi:hypothetical protein